MKPKQVKELLLANIKAVANNPMDYCFNPGSDFTRARKLPLEKLLAGIIGMGSGSLSNEIIDLFGASADTPTSSAFVQQRSKVKPEAFKRVFHRFSNDLAETFQDGLAILAVDGSDIHIPTDPKDTGSYFPGNNGQKGYNLLHLNALFDLKHQIYSDATIQKRLDWNEHKALQEMVDRSTIASALVVADRGYESYNNMAHIQEKGWKFLIRVKDGNSSIKGNLVLPDQASFDVAVHLKLTRKQSKETKALFKDKNHYRFIPTNVNFDYLPAKSRNKDPAVFYELNFRIVRLQISENLYETVLTNLDMELYPPEKLKELYSSRWGIETSFRDLKYTIGMLAFHSKKVMCILQEIYARLTMYNFAEMITSHVAIEKKQRKYTYKANFSVAAHICRLFYHGKTASPDLEAIIAKNLIPIRPDRHRERNLSVKTFRGFLYRVT